MLLKAVELGDKIELNRLATENGEVESYSSKVQELTDTTITILAPMDNGRIIPLELNSRFMVAIYNSKGLYKSEVVVSSRRKEEKLYLIVLTIVSRLQKYQRRQYYRMDCLMTFQYKDDTSNQWNEGLVLDISGGGLRFTSNEKLIQDKGVICHMNFESNPDTQDLYITGQVVASDAIELDSRTYETRLQFDIISDEDREKVIKYIFDEERRRRKKEKGM